jgi:hypothetical protein
VGLIDHSAGLRGEVGSTFSREQHIRPTLLTTHERLSRTGTTRRKRTLGVCGQHTWTGVGSLRVVLVGFSSTGCTSIRIAATLRYE